MFGPRYRRSATSRNTVRSQAMARLVAVVAVPQRHDVEGRRGVGRIEQLQAILLGESGRQPARQRRRHVRLAYHRQRGHEMRRRQADHAAQAVRRERSLQQPDLAARDQPLEPVIHDIAVDRVLVLSGGGDDQMRQRGQALEGQLALRGRVVGAQHPDPVFLEQRLADKRLGHPPEAADRQIDPAGNQRLGHPHVARPDSELGNGARGL